ncbi:MAG: hypothetical protein JW963_17145 [Anaerolineales bacterium]|nr:hypothetical protein [Anaerolineales bacterium]
MTTPELAYQQIEKLLQKFKNMSAAERRKMNENATRQGFILPMFQAQDDEIDQLVYRLYGLTEEEIEIVEGKD